MDDETVVRKYLQLCKDYRGWAPGPSEVLAVPIAELRERLEELQREAWSIPDEDEDDGWRM